MIAFLTITIASILALAFLRAVGKEIRADSVKYSQDESAAALSVIGCIGGIFYLALFIGVVGTVATGLSRVL